MPEPQASSAPGKPAKSKSRLAVTLVAIALLGAGGLYYWIAPDRPAVAANPPGGGFTLALETFVVNLSAPGDRAYLRVGITLALSKPVPKNREEIPTALVRDTVLSVLSTARAEQLLQSEGKRQLKNDILRALQDRLPQMGVQDVYFTEFLVQM